MLHLSVIPEYVPETNTIIHAITSTTIVLMAVANVELTPSIPIFAKIEVSPYAVS